MMLIEKIFKLFFGNASAKLKSKYPCLVAGLRYWRPPIVPPPLPNSPRSRLLWPRYILQFLPDRKCFLPWFRIVKLVRYFPFVQMMG